MCDVAARVRLSVGVRIHVEIFETKGSTVYSTLHVHYHGTVEERAQRTESSLTGFASFVCRGGRRMVLVQRRRNVVGG